MSSITYEMIKYASWYIKVTGVAYLVLRTLIFMSYLLQILAVLIQNYWVDMF